MARHDEGAFGAALRRYRERARLTQEELAERAGLTVNAIGALERGERRRPYRHTVQALAAALGLSPDDRAALAAAVPRRGRPPPAPIEEGTTLAAAVPSPPLLAPLTPLIGREREAAAVAGLLTRGNVRLVTLTGPGGVGKTRLAAHVARDIGPTFPDGVVVIPLAPLVDAALVVPAVAHSLGLREAGGGALPVVLQVSLASKRLLLVLDNCEHVLAAAPAIADLLGACPGVMALATSRAPLRVRGEQEFPLTPLALPALDRVPSADEAAAVPSVRLFAERARAVHPAFALTDANAAAVATLCRRLDGLPLALELAAARVKLLPPAALLARLDRALPLLVGGARDLPARQQTLRSAFHWSYDLLTVPEQRLFRRLAVFVGGCRLEAAEAVCSAPDHPLDVLDGLTSLVDTSLLQVEEQADGEPRFGMLETIRAYALERLEESDEAEAQRRRHAAYYLALAEEAERALHGPDQAAWLAHLEAEHDNLRAALRWTTAAPGAAAQGVRLAAALWPFWEVRGALSEGRRWLEVALGRAAALPRGEASLGRAQVRAGIGAGYLAAKQGDLARAAALLQEALVRAQDLGDTPGTAAALNYLAIVAGYRGDDAAARRLHEEALAVRRTLGDRRDIAFSLSNLALVLCAQGEYVQATALLDDVLALCRESGDQKGRAVALGNRGWVVYSQGDPARATVLYAEALTLAHALGDRFDVAWMLEDLAIIGTAQGQPERAARLFGAAEALREAFGTPAALEAPAVYAQGVQQARAALGEAACAVAWAAGAAMTPEQAVAYALDDSGSA